MVIFTLKHLRKLIKEEILRGVPDFALRQATSRFVAELRQQILKYISQIASDSTSETRAERLQAMNEILSRLENEIHELLEERLIDYLRQV